MICALIAERSSDLPISTCCRVMGVSTSGFCQRGRRCSNTQAERWMRACGAVGIHYPPKRGKSGCARRDGSDPNPDLVQCRFDPDGTDRLWVTDVTAHRTGEGKVYLAAVIDAWSRRVVGWSIADHIRAELVADTLQMATRRRRPPKGQTIAHSDHGSVHTSWLCGHRLRNAGTLGRWDRSATPMTTPSPKRSSRSPSASSSTSTTGPPGTSSPRRSSNGSKPGTTPSAATATTRGSAPSTTRPHTLHDHPTPTPPVKPGDLHFHLLAHAAPAAVLLAVYVWAVRRWAAPAAAETDVQATSA